jgi:hypothetical protein
VPTNETARAVGHCGVGRGGANNGWSDKASYVTWRRRTKEHPRTRRTLSKSIVGSTIKDIAHAEGVASRHLHHERLVLKNRTGAIGDAAVTAVMYKHESENVFRRMASITWKYRFALCGTELAIRHITQKLKYGLFLPHVTL